MVVLSQKGYDIIKLTTSNLDPKFGGDIRVRYLYNALAGKRDGLRLFVKAIGIEEIKFK